MWEPAVSGMEKAHNCADLSYRRKIIQQYVFLLQKMLVCARICVTQKGEENV